jgi:glycosyltransferase involved in cell wall biosynthesis
VKILMLAQFYPPVIGGEERHVRTLSRSLAARGHDVHVVTMTGAVPGPTPVFDPGVIVHSVPGLGGKVPALYREADRPLALPLPDPVTMKPLSDVIREVDPDVIHAHNWMVFSYLALPDSAHRPLVLTLHDYGTVCATKRLMRAGQPCSGPSAADCLPCAGRHYGSIKGAGVVGALASTRPLLTRRVNRVLAVSSVVKERGWAGDPRDVEVVPNFIPDELLDAPSMPRDAELPEGDYLLFVGDLSAEKGLLTLLTAYENLPAERPALVLIGRPTKDLPSRMPVGVILHRGWDHERVVSAFQHSLGAVLPSEWHDPCPTTVLEAMALGTPLVTTLMGGIADMVTDERSALVVPPGAPQDLAAALTRLSHDSDLRDRLRVGAREQVAGFTASSVVDRVENVYAGLLMPGVSR